MINLDRAQSFALHRAAIDSILAHGSSGTGKSSLANAIAVQATEAGLACLLVGSSSNLNKPLVYRAAGICHPILARRAQVDTQAPRRRQNIDPLEARIRLNPSAMQVAMHALRRARELLEKYRLNPDDVEHSLLAARPVALEALDLIAVITQDATRVADMLWTGNRRSGRSLQDVETAVAGRQTDVPSDEEPLALILAEESDFEQKLASVLTAATRANDEKQLSAVMSALRSPTPTDKTLKELHEHVVWMRQMISDAIDLISRTGSPQAALQAEPRTQASRIVEHFVRRRPRDEAGVAIKLLKDALRQFENDGAALAPYVDRYGSRTIGSVALATQERPFPPNYLSAASFVQKVREARYAARELPGLLGRLRAMLSPTLADEIVLACIEDAATRIEASRVPDERARVANELRQLRDLFAGAGFGDLFQAPADFLNQHENLVSGMAEPGASHSAEILDLLLDATRHPRPNQSPKPTDWPGSHVRARSQHELTEIAKRGDHFDVLVADDVDELDSRLLDHFTATGTRVHRIGSTARSDAIALEIPHRQTNCEIANLVSERPGRWLAGPGGMGVVVRVFGDFDLDFLQSAAGRLVTALQKTGRGASLAPLPRDTITNVLVAVVDTLSNSELRSLAAQAREGIVVFCRRDLRTPETAAEHTPSSDCLVAQSLGWQIRRACADGVLLEKDGRCVALVHEPAALTAEDEVVTDIVDRLTVLGWQPIVAWRDAPRDRAALNALLNSHSMPISGDQTLHTLLERFALEPPPAPPVVERESAHGDHALSPSPDGHFGAALGEAEPDAEPLLSESARPVSRPEPIHADLTGSQPHPAAHPAPQPSETVWSRPAPGPELPEAAPRAFETRGGQLVEPHALEPYEAAFAGLAARVPPPATAQGAQPGTLVPTTDRWDLEGSDVPEAVGVAVGRSLEGPGESDATPGRTAIGTVVEPIEATAVNDGRDVEAAA